MADLIQEPVWRTMLDPYLAAIAARCNRPDLAAEVRSDIEERRAFLFVSDEGFFVLKPLCEHGEIVLRIVVARFSGAKAFRPVSVGRSMLIDSRSAWRPACSISQELASGMALRWM